MAALAAALCVVIAGATAAPGHETADAGPVRLSLGWAEEPAYAGLANQVEVDVTDANGVPVDDPASSLSVEVAFGSEAAVLTLVPTGTPGEWRAAMVPTRAGSYRFRVSGTVLGQPFDVTSTCSATTFHCVVEATDNQFPVQDPSMGELAERVRRESERTARLRDRVAGARRLALATTVIAVAALALGAVAMVAARRSRRSTRQE